MSCPFYGRVAVPTLQLLAERGSHNCALASGPRLTPCQMQVSGQKPEWGKCSENTGVTWKNEMVKWAENPEREKMLIQFDYPD